LCEAAFPGSVVFGPTATTGRGRLGLAAGRDDFGAVRVGPTTTAG
jgi:hypothetical protein